MTKRIPNNAAMGLLNNLGVLRAPVTPKEQLDSCKKELKQMYNSVVKLLKSQEEFGNILRDPRVTAAPNANDIAKVVRGIVNDTSLIKNKLAQAYQQIVDLESVTSPDSYLIGAIGIHQELANLMQNYGDVVAPQLSLLSDMIANVPGADGPVTSELF